MPGQSWILGPGLSAYGTHSWWDPESTIRNSSRFSIATVPIIIVLL